MKKAISLLCLVTLVSCNEGGSGKSKKPNYRRIVEEYQTSLTPVRGTVSLSEQTGNTVTFNWENEGPLKPMVEKVDVSTKEIILKIEGDNVYTYREETDNIERTTTKSVSLSSGKYTDDLTRILESGEGRIVNDWLYLKQTENDEEDMGGDPVQVMQNIWNFNMSLNLRAICESQLTFDMQVRQIKPTVGKWVKATSKTVGKCGNMLSRDDLRELDLTKVEFCDHTLPDDSEESTCVDERDMSYLQNDL